MIQAGLDIQNFLARQEKIDKSPSYHGLSIDDADDSTSFSTDIIPIEIKAYGKTGLHRLSEPKVYTAIKDKLDNYYSGFVAGFLGSTAGIFPADGTNEWISNRSLNIFRDISPITGDDIANEATLLPSLPCNTISTALLTITEQFENYIEKNTFDAYQTDEGSLIAEFVFDDGRVSCVLRNKYAHILSISNDGFEEKFYKDKTYDLQKIITTLKEYIEKHV